MGYNNYHLDMIVNNVSLPQINSWFSEFYIIAQEQFILMRVAISDGQIITFTKGTN